MRCLALATSFPLPAKNGSSFAALAVCWKEAAPHLSPQTALYSFAPQASVFGLRWAVAACVPLCGAACWRICETGLPLRASLVCSCGRSAVIKGVPHEGCSMESDAVNLRGRFAAFGCWTVRAPRRYSVRRTCCLPIYIIACDLLILLTASLWPETIPSLKALWCAMRTRRGT
jgi:hypothetical protein